MFNDRKSSRGKVNRKAPRTQSNFMAPRSNRYQLSAGVKIDYKNLNVVQKFITDRGKIVSRRLSGVSASKQREIVTAIKRARYLGLLITGVKKR